MINTAVINFILLLSEICHLGCFFQRQLEKHSDLFSIKIEFYAYSISFGIGPIVHSNSTKFFPLYKRIT